jgi:hypothetical protein
VGLVVGDALLVVDATVEGDVEAEGQLSLEEKPALGFVAEANS